MQGGERWRGGAEKLPLGKALEWRPQGKRKAHHENLPPSFLILAEGGCSEPPLPKGRRERSDRWRQRSALLD